MAKTILIVDDDPTQRRLLELALGESRYQTRCAASGGEALDMLHGPEALDIDLVLLDVAMPDIDGIEVLKKVHALRPSLPFVMLTAHGSVNLVVKAMRAGSVDFVVKPVSPDKLNLSVDNALRRELPRDDGVALNQGAGGRRSFDDIVGASDALADAVALARRGAATNVPILIEGESGVGKEMFARAIHDAGARSDRPLVIVNCGALPENLVESILFGHEKGSFTGAVERHRGKFQEAHGGTLFLDEIGELPPDIQVKLLRALQDGEIEPVGGSGTVAVDVRLISATNRDLAVLVKTGGFREDLYYRLNVFPVRIPALRERREDIPLLVDHMIARIAASEDRAVAGVTSEALNRLKELAWPGNVRQLENALFRAVVLSDSETLSEADFAQLLNPSEPPAPAKPATATTLGPDAPPVDDPAPGDAVVPVVNAEGDIREIHDIESEVIALALRKYKGRMSEIARRLGIGRSTLYRKITDIGLDGRARHM